MDRTTRFRVNVPQIIWETIEGEVLLIDLGTGNYFSLRGSAAVIWHAVERGASIGEVASTLERAYEGEEKLETPVIRFVEEIVAEELLIPVGPDDEPASTPVETVVSGDRFETPLLEKYTDMQDLVLLDPVHDFKGAEGWPGTKPTP